MKQNVYGNRNHLIANIQYNKWEYIIVYIPQPSEVLNDDIVQLMSKTF